MMRFIMEFYVPVFISVSLNAKKLSLEGPLDYVSIVLAALFSLLLVLIPVYYAIIIYRNRNRLADPDTIDRYSVLYDGLKKNSIAALLTHQVFLLRRLLMVIVLLFCKFSIHLQVALMLIINYLALVNTVLVRPYENLKDNLNTAITEVALAIAST